MIWIIKVDGRVARDVLGYPLLFATQEKSDSYAKRKYRGRGYALVGFDVDTETVVRIDKEK